MKLDDLKTCLLLSEEQHFGRAAARAHLTQPAVSQAIKRVEREYGVQIFDRSSRQVRPTPAGAAMMPHIRALVERTQTLRNVACERSLADATSVTVGFPAVLRPVLRRMSCRLATQETGLVLRPATGTAAEQRVRLLEGTVDVAFLPGSLVPAGHLAVALPPVRLSVLVALSTRSVIGLGGLLVPDVRDATVVHPPDPTDLLRAGMDAEAPLRFVANPEDLVDQVLAGQGAALLDPSHVDDAWRPQLRAVSLPRPAATAEYHAVARDHDVPSVRALLGVAADLARVESYAARRLAG
jgi:DNA-binding transcriptional LysR family regulator